MPDIWVELPFEGGRLVGIYVSANEPEERVAASDMSWLITSVVAQIHKAFDGLPFESRDTARTQVLAELKAALLAAAFGSGEARASRDMGITDLLAYLRFPLLRDAIDCGGTFVSVAASWLIPILTKSPADAAVAAFGAIGADPEVIDALENSVLPPESLGPLRPISLWPVAVAVIGAPAITKAALLKLLRADGAHQPEYWRAHGPAEGEGPDWAQKIMAPWGRRRVGLILLGALNEVDGQELLRELLDVAWLVGPAAHEEPLPLSLVALHDELTQRAGLGGEVPPTAIGHVSDWAAGGGERERTFVRHFGALLNSLSVKREHVRLQGVDHFIPPPMELGRWAGVSHPRSALRGNLAWWEVDGKNVSDVMNPALAEAITTLDLVDPANTLGGFPIRELIKAPDPTNVEDHVLTVRAFKTVSQLREACTAMRLPPSEWERLAVKGVCALIVIERYHTPAHLVVIVEGAVTHVLGPGNRPPEGALIMQLTNALSIPWPPQTTTGRALS